MSNITRSASAPVLLAAAALMVAALGFIALVFVGSLAQSLAVPTHLVATVLGPVLLVTAGMIWRDGLQRGDRSMRVAVIALTAAAAATSALFRTSLAAGMDDGDAGRAIGVFGGLTWWFALASIVLAGGTAGLLTRVLLDREARVIPAAVGLVAAVPAFVASMNPASTVLGSLIVLTTMLAGTIRRPPAPSMPDAGSRGSRPETRGRSVRAMGVLALAVLAVVWGAAALLGTAEAGRPAATTAMAYGLALGPLAAVPLLYAITAFDRLRDLRRYLVVPIAGIVLGSAVQVVAMNPDGTAAFTGSTIAGVAVGSWVAMAVVPRPAVTTGVRATIGAAIIVGAVLTWFLLITMSAGLSLAVPAVVAIVVGRRGQLSRRAR